MSGLHLKFTHADLHLSFSNSEWEAELGYFYHPFQSLESMLYSLSPMLRIYSSRSQNKVIFSPILSYGVQQAIALQAMSSQGSRQKEEGKKKNGPF